MEQPTNLTKEKTPLLSTSIEPEVTEKEAGNNVLMNVASATVQCESGTIIHSILPNDTVANETLFVDDRPDDIVDEENCSDHCFVLNPTLIALSISVALGLVSGTLYAFGRYSKDLKESLFLTQYQVARLGILLDSGNYIGHPLTGLIYDTFGSRVSCLSAGLIVFVAYGFIHLGVNANRHELLHLHDEPSSVYYPYWIFAVSFFLVGFGSGLGFIAALGTTTKNFQSSHHHGLAIAVVAAGFGLCSTIVGISYQIIGLYNFFLLWAVLVAFVNALGALFLSTTTQYDELNELENTQNTDSYNHEATGAILLPEIHHHEVDNETNEAGISNTLLTASPSTRQRNENETESPSESSARHDQAHLQWGSWRTLDFWLLFFAFACCTGCGLFVINNVSTIVESMGGEDSFAGKLVILLSLSNCSGRILIGYLADEPKLSKRKLHLFACDALVMSFALYLSAAASGGGRTQHVCFAVTVALVAAAYGGTWVLVVSILADWFGNLHFGKNYGLIALGPAVSGMLFNMASAWIYEKHTVANSGGIATDLNSASFMNDSNEGATDDDINGSLSKIDEKGVCFGPACYRLPFVLTGTAALFSTFLLAILGYRRKVYRFHNRHHRS